MMIHGYLLFCMRWLRRFKLKHGKTHEVASVIMFSQELSVMGDLEFNVRLVLVW